MDDRVLNVSIEGAKDSQILVIDIITIPELNNNKYIAYQVPSSKEPDSFFVSRLVETDDVVNLETIEDDNELNIVESYFEKELKEIEEEKEISTES